jgi:hypothetical protein
MGQKIILLVFGVLLFFGGMEAHAAVSSWIWWGATNPIPVSAANPLPVACQ